MKESVISLICVAAWNTLTSRPTARPDSKTGAETRIITSRARWPSVITVSGDMAASRDEALRKRTNQEVPAVGKDEKHQLERQRDDDGGKHHHSHGHEYA